MIDNNRPNGMQRGTLLFFRTLLLALLASVMLAPSSAVWAQDEDEEDAQARAAAEARAKAAAEERARAQVFTNLAAQVRELAAQEAALLQQQQAEAREDLQEQERLAQEQVARRDRAEANSAALDRQWEANEKTIAETSELLRQHEGNLGELFGVTRQIAGDAAGVMQESLLSTQFTPRADEEERADFMRRLAGAKALPSIRELERLWYELMREMNGSGRTVRYQADVLQLENGASTGTAETEEVVRVGPFTAIRGNDFLGYLRGETSLTELDGVLTGGFRSIAGDLFSTPPDAGYTEAVVDPSGGALLGLYLRRPNWVDRIHLGETVGYVIIAVGILGVLLAMFQAAYLLRTRLAVNSQLKDISQPKDDNPLGRLLLAFGSGNGEGSNKKPDNVEVAELRLSEAVLREVPKLERFQAFLRLAVAAGPLLGLIGTVIGMIITFHAIVASGSSDPKLMAHGIGQAMIATVLGLGIAIPLLFINAGLTAFSRGVTQILDEQSDALLAETIVAHKARYGY
ncbi:MAG TPA: MotA/TolQ/ExbB proton channel family protein [Woeseiaceae bacterium]|nr:MotA/TolQ/ExbB proton channel family protein [Woeseiaceae bacterium]